MMKRSMSLILFFLLLSLSVPAEELNYDVGYGTIRFTEQGNINVVFTDGVQWPKSVQSAFILETKEGKPVYSSKVVSSGDKMTVTFTDGSSALFTVKPNKGFLLFQLEKFDPKQKFERFQVMKISVPQEARIASLTNTATWEGKSVSAMTASPNILPIYSHTRSDAANRQGCSHIFEQITNSKVGHYAARFQATSNDQPGGWSVRGRAIPKMLNLTGYKGIRVWVHGDGNREALKIQLSDNKGGNRDDYIDINFKGWKQLFLEKPALNDLDYSCINFLRFYYNGLPVNQTVECLVDQVEMVLDDNGKEKVVLLEDFESSNSILWDQPNPALSLESVARHGLTPVVFGIICSPEDQWTTIVPKFQEAAGIPSPRLGGVWNKESSWIRESYFFLTGFKESQFDEALKIAKRGNFKMILLLDTWTKSHGHYEVNTNNYPDGIDSLKRVFKRFNDEGMKVGLHFLAASIYYPDSYLTPVPDKRLVKGARVSLANDIDEKTDFIETMEPPHEFPKTEGNSYMDSGRTLWIDNEMIYYDTVSLEKPYGFSGCKRGYYNTVKSGHKKNTDIWHLIRAYGYYMYDLDSSLAEEIADNLAKTVNQLPVSMIYFDGSEKLQKPDDGGDHWYYNAILHRNFYNKIKNKNILYQASSTSPYSWHQLARTASADGHDDLRAYLEERSGGFKSYYKENHYPLDIGWYYAYDKKATPDMYEYILTKSIAYDSSMSLQVSVDAAKAHPFIGEILDMIRLYDDLRLSGRVPKELREKMEIDPALFGLKTEEARNALLDKRRDFHYMKKNGQEGFQRVIFDLWQKIELSDSKTFEFDMTVKEGRSLIGFQIQACELTQDQTALKENRIVNPKVEINGKTLTLPMTLSPGQYGFYWGGDKLAQYGMPLSEGKYFDQKGDLLFLPDGQYKVKFSCDGAITLPLRIRTTRQPNEFHTF